MVEEANTKPHDPVGLEVKARPREMTTRVIKSFSSYPIERPIGCNRRRVDWEGLLRRLKLLAM